MLNQAMQNLSLEGVEPVINLNCGDGCSSEEDKKAQVKRDDFKLFRSGCTHGRLDIVTFCIENVAKKQKLQMILEGKYAGFRAAVAGGSESIVQAIFDMMNIEDKRAMIECSMENLLADSLQASTLELILTQIRPKFQYEIINNPNPQLFNAFNCAVANNLHTLLHVFLHCPNMTSKTLQSMVDEKFKPALMEGAHLGHKEVVKVLLEYEESGVVVDMGAILTANENAVFMSATKEGHHDTLEYLLSISASRIPLSSSAKHDILKKGLNIALKEGHGSVVELLFKAASSKMKKKMISYNMFESLLSCAQCSEPSACESNARILAWHIKELFDGVAIKELHESKHYIDAILRTIMNKNMDAFSVILHINTLLPSHEETFLQELLKPFELLLFRAAVMTGSVSVFRCVKELSGLAMQPSSRDARMEAFRHCAEKGCAELLTHVWEESVLYENDKQQLLLPSSFSSIFVNSSISGFFEVMTALLGFLDAQQRDSFIKSDAYRHLIVDAAAKGKLTVLVYLMAKVADKDKELVVCMNSFELFAAVGSHGHVEIAIQLLSYVEDHSLKLDMVANDNYRICRKCIENGHSDVLELLLTLVAEDPDHFRQMVASCGIQTYRMSLQWPKVAAQLMQISSAYVQYTRNVCNPHFQRVVVAPYVLERLQKDRNKRSSACVVTLKEMSFYVYMLQILLKHSVDDSYLAPMEYLFTSPTLRNYLTKGLLLHSLVHNIIDIAPENTWKVFHSMPLLSALFACRQYTQQRVGVMENTDNFSSLFSSLSPAQQDTLVQYNKFDILKQAVARRDIDLVQILISGLAFHEQMVITGQHFYNILVQVVDDANIAILEVLLQCLGSAGATEERHMALKMPFIESAFLLSVDQNNKEMTNFCLAQVSHDAVRLRTLVAADDHHWEKHAASTGQLEVVIRLVETHAVMQDGNYVIFNYAVLNGQMNIIEYLPASIVKDAVEKDAIVKGAVELKRHLPMSLGELLIALAGNGNMAMLKYFINKFDCIEKELKNASLVRSMCQQAIKQNTLMCLNDSFPNFVTDIFDTETVYSALHSAIAPGVDLVQFLLEKMRSKSHTERLYQCKVEAELAQMISNSSDCSKSDHQLWLENELKRLTNAEPRHNMEMKKMLDNAIVNDNHNLVSHLLHREISVSDRKHAASNFALACRQGHVDTVRVVMSFFVKVKDRKEFFELAAQNDRHTECNVLCEAAACGHMGIVDYFLKEIQQVILEDMISSTDYTCMCAAVENDHISVLERLLTHTEFKGSKMVLQSACRTNKLGVIKYLFSHQNHALLGDNVINNCFEIAASWGHLGVVDYLYHASSTEGMKKGISASSYSISFAVAAQKGRAEVVKFLYENAQPSGYSHIIKDASLFQRASVEYAAFVLAARNGHAPVVTYLLENIDVGEKSVMIQSNDGVAFVDACSGNHLAVVQVLVAEVDSLITNNNYAGFHEAVAANGARVADFLLNSMCEEDINAAVRGPHLLRQNRPATNRALVWYSHILFAYADLHTYEYRSVVREVVSAKLVSLRQQQTDQQMLNPNNVFDITHHDAMHCFYIIKHLTAQNTVSATIDVRFLLGIPAVQRLAHTTQSNIGSVIELLEHAEDVDNSDVQTLLLSLPSVFEVYSSRNQAQIDARTSQLQRQHQERQHQHHHQRHQQPRQARVAQEYADTESSMRSLTASEKSRLKKVLLEYEPRLKSIGKYGVFKTLTDKLEADYIDAPAKFRDTPLPLTWSGFVKLSSDWTSDDKKLAKNEYYKNKLHTSLRYLSKPNMWMSRDANYVEGSGMHRYSTFGEYTELISLLYLAVDDSSVLTEDYTLQSRFDHFVTELAMIGRAHNWDKSRPRADGCGLEEYDDQGGDKPSCYSGVKRRLFQAVVGHPLFVILTQDIVQEKMREFIRARFIGVIEALPTKDHLATAWEELCNTGVLDESALSHLRQLDITPSQQQQFLQHMQDEYQEQFGEDLQQFVQQYFQLNTAIFPCHAAKFGGEVADLSSLLEAYSGDGDGEGAGDGKDDSDSPCNDETEEGGAEERKGQS